MSDDRFRIAECSVRRMETRVNFARTLSRSNQYSKRLIRASVRMAAVNRRARETIDRARRA